jgi:hypothetical protein
MDGERGADEHSRCRGEQMENANKSRWKFQNHYPPYEKKISFFLVKSFYNCYIAQTVYISNNLLPLHMSYSIEIHNRVNVGFALGWSFYGSDEDYGYSELILFIGLISINIKKTVR